MPLPDVPAWITDYATAHAVFCGNDNAVKQVITQICADGRLKFCAEEEKSFRGQPEVNQVFCVNGNCRCNLSADIAAIASSVTKVINGKKHHPSDNSAKIIVACAIHHGFGIVSAKSGMFLTPLEVGTHHNIPCLSLTSFLAAL